MTIPTGSCLAATRKPWAHHRWIGWKKPPPRGVWESAGFPVPYSESSSRDTGLFTGGQGARESQGVIDLIAPLTVESELLPYMNEWDFLDGFSPFLQQSSPLVSVPSQLIRVGTLGNLGNDGHLFTVQSSGNEIVITLTAPSTDRKSV